MPSNTNTHYTIQDLNIIIKDVENSGCFGRSKRQLQLFEYLLSQSIAGKSSVVTQYSIAIDVLDRPESFDANTDSIVRVEMHRLRANLEAYNAGGFEFLISVPPAGFQVIVKPRKQSLTSSLAKKTMPIAATTLLAMATFCIGYAMPDFNSRLDINSTKSFCSKTLPNLRVNNAGAPSETQIYVEKVIRSTVSQQTGFNLVPDGGSCESGATAPTFTINYTAFDQGDNFSITLSVINNNTKSIISSHHVSGGASEKKEGTDLYFDIVKTANAISMPDSITARMAMKERWQSDTAKNAFSCIIKMYDSFSGGSEVEFNEVQQCLESSIESEFAPLDNYGAIAANYLDLARNGDPAQSIDSFLAAETIINQNESAWIDSAELTIAKLYYEAQRPDFNAERFASVLMRAEARYNTNPLVMSTIATFYGYSLSEWDEAKRISNRVKQIYSVRDQSIFGVDAGYAIMKLNGTNLMDHCAKYYGANSVYINVIINACAHKAKNLDWIGVTEANLLRENVSTLEDRMQVFESLKHDRRFVRVVRNILEASLN